MPASPDGVARLHAWLDRALADAGHDVAAAWPIYVAIDEAIINVARHGYGANHDGEVEATVCLEAGAVLVTLADDAPPFNPRNAPRSDGTNAPGPRPGHAAGPGGHGIALVLGLVDHVSYEYRDGRNVLTLAVSLEAGPRRTP